MMYISVLIDIFTDEQQNGTFRFTTVSRPAAIQLRRRRRRVMTASFAYDEKFFLPFEMLL